MRFWTRINLGNAAFNEDRAGELARIMAVIARQLETGSEGEFVFDANGNACGEWGIDVAESG